MLLNCTAGEDSWKFPWTARRSNQSILKETSPEYSLEGLMLKLKLQYFGTWSKKLTHSKRPWCWERLRAGGKGVDRGWDGWIASLNQCIWVWANSRRQWRRGKTGVLQAMGSQSQTWLSNWTTTMKELHIHLYSSALLVLHFLTFLIFESIFCVIFAFEMYFSRTRNLSWDLFNIHT